MTGETPQVSLTDYSLLGRTGLRISPFCLGAMTFGTGNAWGAEEAECQRIFDCYLDAGGNFIDTANIYSKGQSEAMLGKFIPASGMRDRIVLATKFSITMSPGDPNASGNGRKNIYRSLEASLRTLNTDYIDLYWLHVWDTLTPIDEVMDTLDDLVRGGKVRYIGFSDVPAWYMAKAQTYAELRGTCRIAAAQLQYSLADRSIEVEHVAAAQDLDIGICSWGSLAGGMLSGKYHQAEPGTGRLTIEPQYRRHLSDHNARILEALGEVGRELGRSPAQVALNWITRRPAVRATIVGASRATQLEENLKALDFVIPPELSQRLDEASKVALPHLYSFFGEFGEQLRAAKVSARPKWDRDHG